MLPSPGRSRHCRTHLGDNKINHHKHGRSVLWRQHVFETHYPIRNAHAKAFKLVRDVATSQQTACIARERKRSGEGTHGQHKSPIGSVAKTSSTFSILSRDTENSCCPLFREDNPDRNEVPSKSTPSPRRRSDECCGDDEEESPFPIRNSNRPSASTRRDAMAQPVVTERVEAFEGYLGNCRDVNSFVKIERIGEGTYGTVCKPPLASKYCYLLICACSVLRQSKRPDNERYCGAEKSGSSGRPPWRGSN